MKVRHNHILSQENLGSLSGPQQGAAEDVIEPDSPLTEKSADGSRLLQAMIAQRPFTVRDLSAVEGLSVSKEIQVLLVESQKK